MKLQLNSYKVQELAQSELLSKSGGWVTPAILVAVIISAVNNWHDIREGWCDETSGRPPRHEC